MSLVASLRRVILAVAVLAIVPLPVSATGPRPVVTGAWIGAPAGIPLDVNMDVVLRLEATAEADVTAEVLPSDGIEIVGGQRQWTGSLARGGAIDLPLTVRFIANGEWTLGAAITNRRLTSVQGSGAVLNVIAVDGMATLSSDPHALMKISAAVTARELSDLGIGPEALGSGVRPRSGLPLVATTVSGTVNWKDPENNSHPVRRALVEIADQAGAVISTSTNDAGVYSAPINADRVKVTVHSRDFDDLRVVVFRLGQPTQRYRLESDVTPVTGATTTVNIDSGATERGTRGRPSNDSLIARAFSVYDGMLTYWFQMSAILGANMQQVHVNFPNTTTNPGCPSSCYDTGNQQIYILREDALDWDVIGHEFFHFVTHRAARRPIDTNPAGEHTGGTAIGQAGRNRDQGMRLAWSEGLATFMALDIQKNPPSSFAFPKPPAFLIGINNDHFEDDEEDSFATHAENPDSSDGFGSENSVLGLLWDMADSNQDGDDATKDTINAVPSRFLWQLLNTTLPCNPCDRVDRLWSSIVNLFGQGDTVTFQAAKLFVLNNMAPKATAPADNSSVGGTAAPTFQWERRGDPSASHRNNQFFLAFSRDFFRSRIVIPVAVNGIPTLDATSFTPTDEEWQSVQAGAGPGVSYQWSVFAKRPDDPPVPTTWFWYSNVSTITPRSLEATITWTPVGADVDLHLANPSGRDIAYFNKTTSWGSLDRDCITTCAQEIISVSSLPLRGTYQLFAHYFSDRGRGPATVRAVVRAGNRIVAEQTFTLGSTGATRVIFGTTISGIDGPDATPAEAVGDVSLDPALLPPKSHTDR